jgi:ABC-2 type transport system permease protein
MNAFTGTGRLARLALRRDRIQLPVWILGLTALWAFSVSAVVDLYPSEEDRMTLAVVSANSPAALMGNGIVSGTSIGATVAAQALLFMLIAAAIMSTFAVVRHTRQNEETGRAELVGAGIVGRHASLTGALLVVGGANLVLALLSALVLIANGLPVGGSLISGAAIAAVGIVFAAIAAVAAQISGTSRGANGMAAGAVGVAFVLRAVGDAASTAVDASVRVVSAWPSWLSPIGWGQQVRPYDGDQWWVLSLFVVASAALVATAFVLASHRDVGAGLRAVPAGPAVAPRGLLSPMGLAWRLQRGVLLGWAIAMAFAGFTYGGLGNEVEELVGSSDQMAELVEEIAGGGDLVDAFFAFTFIMAGLAVAGYAVQALLRMRAEESSGRLEPVLATGVSRSRWMWTHVAIAALGSVGLLALLGLTTGFTFGLVAGDPATRVAELLPAALAQAPAALAVGGLVTAMFGLVPRWVIPLSWAALVLFVFAAMFGGLIGLPQALLDLSPFTHVPAAPSVDVSPGPLAALCLVAVAFVVVGLAWFRRRDLALS